MVLLRPPNTTPYAAAAAPSPALVTYLDGTALRNQAVVGGARLTTTEEQEKSETWSIFAPFCIDEPFS